MTRWNNIIFLLFLYGYHLFSTHLLFSAEPIASTEISQESVSLDTKLEHFIDFVRGLQKDGLFDGEILVAHHDQILLNLQNEDIASTDPQKKPQFMIGSVSKQFFAVALLKALYESSANTTEELKIADVKRKLHWPISQFLPKDSIIWDGRMPAWAEEVSLHHLLTHTSGIPNYTDTEAYGYSNLKDTKKRWFESYRPTNEIITLISEDPLQFPPGSKHSYSNTGYVLVAEVIEAITSLSASQYLQQALFDPLKLSSTINPAKGTWEQLRLDSKISRLVPPLKYDPMGNQQIFYPLLHCEDISAAKGAGSIISTAADLLKWNQSLHTNKSVLPEELYQLFITDNMDKYGYGIGVENIDGKAIYGHGGGIGTYQTLLLYMPEYDISIILLSNIAYDFDKVEDEYKALLETLRETISDEKEREMEAQKMIQEKYPNTRGFEMIGKNTGKAFE